MAQSTTVVISGAPAKYNTSVEAIEATEIFQRRVKLLGHGNQSSGAAKLRPTGNGNWNQLHHSVAVADNIDRFAANRLIDEAGKLILSLVNRDLLHDWFGASSTAMTPTIIAT